MTYSSVHHFFENNQLLPSECASTDYDDAVRSLILVCENVEIEYFDIHDLINAIANHYKVEPSALLEEYDEYCKNPPLFVSNIRL
jgi:hypothetical protein